MIGTSAGLGIHIFVLYSLQKEPLNEVAESFHEVKVSDTINMILFTAENVDEMQPNTTLKYIPNSCGLSVTIHFKCAHQVDRIKPHVHL
jgi:hypothetical protein